MSLKQQNASIKLFFDDDLKYEDHKNVFFSRSYMKHEMNRAQSEAHNFFVFLGWQKYILKEGYGRLSHFHKSTR